MLLVILLFITGKLDFSNFRITLDYYYILLHTFIKIYKITRSSTKWMKFWFVIFEPNIFINSWSKFIVIFFSGNLKKYRKFVSINILSLKYVQDGILTLFIVDSIRLHSSAVQYNSRGGTSRLLYMSNIIGTLS